MDQVFARYLTRDELETALKDAMVKRGGRFDCEIKGGEPLELTIKTLTTSTAICRTRDGGRNVMIMLDSLEVIQS